MVVFNYDCLTRKLNSIGVWMGYSTVLFGVVSAIAMIYSSKKTQIALRYLA